MTWQENLFQNLLTVIILLALFIFIYLRITKKTLGDMIREIREALEPPEVTEHGI